MTQEKTETRVLAMYDVRGIQKYIYLLSRQHMWNSFTCTTTQLWNSNRKILFCVSCFIQEMQEISKSPQMHFYRCLCVLGQTHCIFRDNLRRNIFPDNSLIHDNNPHEAICGSNPAALGCVSFEDLLAVPDVDIPDFFDWFRPIVPVAG